MNIKNFLIFTFFIVLHLYGSQSFEIGKKIYINDLDQTLAWEKFLVDENRTEISKLPNTFQGSNLSHPILPKSPGDILFIKAQLHSWYVDYFNYKLSAETAHSRLKILQTICAKEKNIPIMSELSEIISDRLEYIELLSHKYSKLFSLHIHNKDVDLAQKLLEDKRKVFFLDQDYQKCQKLYSSTPFLVSTCKNIYSLLVNIIFACTIW